VVRHVFSGNWIAARYRHAHTAESSGSGFVYSRGLAAQTRHEVALRSTKQWMTGMDAPITMYDIEGHRWQWCRLEDPDLNEIERIVINGPPYSVGRLASYPAGPSRRRT